MTTTHPDEDKYVRSSENQEVIHQLADAMSRRDEAKIDELCKKLILPLKYLKVFGKESVLELGLPTITAEIANDTDWLK